MEIVMAVIGVLTIAGAYFGAKKGADATIRAARIASESAERANRISLAQSLTASEDPKIKALGWQLLVAEAQALGASSETPVMIQGLTRTPDLQRELDRLRTIREQTGQQPSVGHSEPPGGYL